jgi:hypothetical protein
MYPKMSTSIHITGRIKVGKLMVRWDNAPHHKNLKTYPHHKHTSQLEESTEVNLEDIVNQIDKVLTTES